ncbi:MAG: hypothetical protein JNJ78_00850 [Anaerolineae bacterium]|nr:hypothetical protein [Anaerolineae bacterium]
MSYRLSLFQLDEPSNPDRIQLLRHGTALVLSVLGAKIPMRCVTIYSNAVRRKVGRVMSS